MNIKLVKNQTNFHHPLSPLYGMPPLREREYRLWENEPKSAICGAARWRINKQKAAAAAFLGDN